MRFLLNLGEVSALQSLRVKKSWHLRQGCMKIHRLAWVDACFSSPLAPLSSMHVFFSLLGCFQLFYHWQVEVVLRRYQIKPQCINQRKERLWVKKQGRGFFSCWKPKAKLRCHHRKPRPNIIGHSGVVWFKKIRPHFPHLFCLFVWVLSNRDSWNLQSRPYFNEATIL